MDNPMMDDTPQQRNQEDSLEELQGSRLNTLFSESDGLFLRDIDNNDIIKDDVEAAKYMWALKKISHKSDELKETKRQFDAFFKQKQQSIEDTEVFIKTKLQSYLEDKGENAVTPAGTAYLAKGIKVNYPDDEVLLEYSKAHDIEYKIKETPYKSKVKEFIEAGGEPPEGYSTEESVSVIVRS